MASFPSLRSFRLRSIPTGIGGGTATSSTSATIILNPGLAHRIFRHLCKAVVFREVSLFFCYFVCRGSAALVRNACPFFELHLVIQTFLYSNELYSLVTFCAISVARIGDTVVPCISMNLYLDINH